MHWTWILSDTVWFFTHSKIIAFFSSVLFLSLAFFDSIWPLNIANIQCNWNSVNCFAYMHSYVFISGIVFAKFWSIHQQQKRHPQHRVKKIALNLNQIKIRQAHSMEIVRCFNTNFLFHSKHLPLCSIRSHQERFCFFSTSLFSSITIIIIIFLGFCSSSSQLIFSCNTAWWNRCIFHWDK